MGGQSTIMYFLGPDGLFSGNGSFAIGLWDAHSLNFWCILMEGDLVSPAACTLALCNAPWVLADVVKGVIDLSKDIEISFTDAKRSTN